MEPVSEDVHRVQKLLPGHRLHRRGAKAQEHTRSVKEVRGKLQSCPARKIVDATEGELQRSPDEPPDSKDAHEAKDHEVQALPVPHESIPPEPFGLLALQFEHVLEVPLEMPELEILELEIQLLHEIQGIAIRRGPLPTPLSAWGPLF